MAGEFNALQERIETAHAALLTNVFQFAKNANEREFRGENKTMFRDLKEAAEKLEALRKERQQLLAGVGVAI